MEGFPCRLCWEGTICLARPPPGASATSLALKGGLKVLRFFSRFLIIYFSYLTKWMAGRSKGSRTNVNCLFILKIQKSHSTGRLAWWHNRITDTCLEENCMMKENRDALDFYIKLLNGIHQELNFLWSPLSCINIQIYQQLELWDPYCILFFPIPQQNVVTVKLHQAVSFLANVIVACMFINLQRLT